MMGRRTIVASAWMLHFAFWLIATPTRAQSTVAAEADEDDGGFAVRDSDVGYIDSAVLGNLVRLRYDAAYGSNVPNRAEYFYAPSRPVGPGLPKPEVAVDYQDVQFYLEHQAHDLLSLFVELDVRGINPIVNENTAGLSDMNAGVKCRLWETSRWLATGQFRVYAPTGDVDRGLGTGHASLEPGLLLMHRIDDRWTASGELRYWTAVDGSAFAGDLIRYGLGLQYRSTSCDWFGPVVELVGWTVLDGRKSELAAPGGTVVAGDASGDTILNIKLGGRVTLTRCHDLYIGYGRALTGDRWYDDVLRAELRYAY